MESLTDTRPRVRRERLGGPAGNEILTTGVGALLAVLLIAEGITIIFIGGLVSVHMFIGLVLIPPVALKLMSTGYRFARYYTASEPYRRKGPPALPLRLLAPALMLTTIGVFVTGVLLMSVGHMSDQLLFWHKFFFFAWGPIFGIHFLAYAPRMLRALRKSWVTSRAHAVSGQGLREALLAASLGAGVALATSLVGVIAHWSGGDLG